jgi:diaminopimelate epimerase
MREYRTARTNLSAESNIPMRSAPQVQSGKQDPITFTKMAGGGNDFVVIDNRTLKIADAAELTRRICTRALSVGADGLILIETSVRATFRMRYYNSDGSLGEFCGNGTRCAARFAFTNVIAGKQMTIETDAGIVSATIGEGGTVSITLPPPYAFKPERPVKVEEKVIRGSSIMVGVPHYVIFLRDDLWQQDIAPLGRAIRKHPELQPAGTNVNFVVVRDEHSIEVRTYERGVEAETLSCGSGVVASAVASALFGRVKPPVSVLVRSGTTYEVAFEVVPGGVDNVRLKGDARIIFRAAVTPETLEGFDPDFVRDPSAATVTQ